MNKKDTKNKKQSKDNPNVEKHVVNPIQWFPGHMAKTRRLMKECLSLVDVTLELLDARIPYSSRNPEITKLLENRKHVVLLNKASLADPNVTAKFIERFKRDGVDAIAIDCITGQGISDISPKVRALLAEKLERYKERGMANRPLRAMIVGVPNVGKSSLFNKLGGKYKAKVENRPGVTLRAQWTRTTIGLELLDMPGVLWPKFDDERVGLKLAFTGAIKDTILDSETLAIKLTAFLRTNYKKNLIERYKIDENMINDENVNDLDIFLEIGKRRGLLVSGGEVDAERTAAVLLSEFRSGKLGRITIDECRL